MGHRTHHSGNGSAVTLANVRAGGTVRMRLRLLDGGVALDWTDERVGLRDIAVWSEPRQGTIGRPSVSVDGDDPTLLVAEYGTHTYDLPGLHCLVADVSFAGWTAAHTVMAYNLVNNLYGGGSSLSAVEGYAEEEGPVDLEISLHDVSTTWLQRLIDHLLKLRGSENMRLTALEVVSGQLRADTDANTEDIASLEDRMGTAEENISSLGESKQDKLIEGEGISISEDNVISATGAASDCYTKEETDALLGNYCTREEASALAESKQDKLTPGENISISDENVISATGGAEARAMSAETVEEIWNETYNG